MARTNANASRGFTLIELMVVMALIALLVTLAAPRYFDSIDRARESALKENLARMRVAIDQFYGDRGRYPAALQELVDLRYLRRIPPDPFTERTDSWVAVQATGAGGVVDVKSGAPGSASDGSAYATW